MDNVDVSNLFLSEIVNITPAKGKILVSFTSEFHWEVLAFPKDCFMWRNDFVEEIDILITPSKNVCVRLKYCDDRLASSFQYIFHTCSCKLYSFWWNETILKGNQCWSITESGHCKNIGNNNNLILFYFKIE